MSMLKSPCKIGDEVQIFVENTKTGRGYREIRRVNGVYSNLVTLAPSGKRPQTSVTYSDIICGRVKVL